MTQKELTVLLSTIAQNRKDVKLSEILFSPKNTLSKLKRIKNTEKALQKALNNSYSILNHQEMAVITSYKNEYVR